MAESDHQVASIVDGALFLGYNYLKLEIVGQKLELRELCQTLLKKILRWNYSLCFGVQVTGSLPMRSAMPVAMA